MNAPRAPQESAQPDLPPNLEDLVPAFALGAADPDEADAVLHALAVPALDSPGTAKLARELATFLDLGDLLAYSAPPAAAPAALEQQLRSALAMTAAAGVKPVKPADPLPASQQVDHGRRWHWPQTLAVAASAAAVLLLLLNIYWVREIGALRTSQDVLQQQLDAQSAQFTADMADHQHTLDTQAQQIATQDSILAQLVAGRTERYTMHAVQPGSSAVAEVAWLDQDNTAILRAEGFPPLAEGQAYQLWLLHGDTRTSGGLFTVDDTGCGTYIFHPSQSLEDFDGMGITPEPAAGSPGPTAPPVVRAQL
ncbi:MAG: anti-sigma factor [Caldilineaceae bacterium]